MRFSALNNKNIFAIPAGDLWGIASDSIYMLYAPLNGQISIATQQTVEQMENIAMGGHGDINLVNTLNAFKSKGKVPVYYLPETPHSLHQIDLLLNYTCNFKCTYCYSAAGRSSTQADFENVKAMIDYLFCSSRKQTSPYIINFSGGGEPLLSFDLIKRTIEYIKEVSKGTDYKYNIGLVTNGSLITREIVEYFKANNIDMAVSFEILEHFQNMERGSYDKVAANIDMMLEMGYLFGIRTTFTPDSVCSMSQMVDELHTRFPRLRSVVFDTVLSADIFKTPEMLAEYYDNFYVEYHKAKKKCATLGIKLESIAIETLSIVRDRTCEGKLVLTPEGAISSCARVSSPKERLYEKYIYGSITNGEVEFDQQAFSQIMSENNIYSQKKCHNCFAKWNCGGGCRLFHHSFSEEFVEVKCNFTCKALKKEIFDTLSQNFRKSCDGDLYDYIKTKISSGEIN